VLNLGCATRKHTRRSCARRRPCGRVFSVKRSTVTSGALLHIAAALQARSPAGGDSSSTPIDFGDLHRASRHRLSASVEKCPKANAFHPNVRESCACSAMTKRCAVGTGITTDESGKVFRTVVVVHPRMNFVTPRLVTGIRDSMVCKRWFVLPTNGIPIS